MRLFHIKSRVSNVPHMVQSDPLSLMADICRELLVGDSLASDKLSPSLIPHINGVMSKYSMIATLTLPEGISISECIDALTSYSSTFQAGTRASLDLQTSGFCESWIPRPMIHCAIGVTVTIQQHNNPDADAVQKARCVKKWCGQGDQFNNILIQWDRAPQNNSWVDQKAYCSAKLLYTLGFSDRINTGVANANGSVIWRTFYHDQLLVEDLGYLSSAIPTRTHGMIMWRDGPHRVRRIVDVSSVLTPAPLVQSGEVNQYLLNQYATWESYIMIYLMARICWSQQGCLTSRAITYPCRLLHLVRARVHVRVALVSHIYRSQDCQIMSELTWHSSVNQSRDCQRPCHSHTCQGHTCQSHMIRAGIVRDYIRVYFHSWDCQRLCQSRTCQSHMNQTKIVRPYQSCTCHSRVAMNTR